MPAFLVVDSSCDLPAALFAERKIGILPAQVNIAGRQILDNRDVMELQAFYRQKLLSQDKNAHTESWDAGQISEYALKKIVHSHDYLLVETVARARSSTFENAHSACATVSRDYEQYRSESGKPFSMRVVDSGSVFSGMGVLALHTLDLIARGISDNTLRREVEALKTSVHCYAVVKNIKHLRNQMKKRGDKGLSWLAATFAGALDITPILHSFDNEVSPVGSVWGYKSAVNKLFDEAGRSVRAGLNCPHAVVSIAGLISELDQFDGYQRFKQSCKDSGVEMHTCMMSMTGAINIGQGAVTIGFASDAGVLKF